ncbi:transcriptional regulator, partial [Burkholderia pseudomallei]|nr:transcriptional regulator [Burkholderia pseudomallei]
AAPRTGGSAADRAPGASSAGGDAKPAAAKKPARRGA